MSNGPSHPPDVPSGHLDGDAPLRAELFSAVQMEQHGASLASSHHLARGRARDRMLSRLASNEDILVTTCRQLTAALAAEQRVTPAGEWLIENFYLVEEQIRTARRNLPKGYSRDLPRLAEGPSAGLPRVYDIAIETIAHGDGRVEGDSLSRFVGAYQTITPLLLGELWAIPVMLRLALIENLRRVAMRIAAGRVDRDLAVEWVNRLTKTAEQDPKNLILVIADMARSAPPMSTPFVSELTRRLRGQGPALAMPLTWLEQQLAVTGLSIEQLVRSGNQLQAADQVSVRNSIGSLRSIGSMNWRDFVERLSGVEQTLRTDPGRTYTAMDFASRDRYRHVIEEVSRASGLSENMVAGRAIALATAAAARVGSTDRTTHVGYYLIDRGLTDLERDTRAHLPLGARIRHAVGRSPLLLYLGAIALITSLLTAGLLAKVHRDGVAGWYLAPVGVLAVLVSSHLAVALVNWLATLLVAPRPLPRMDFSRGIPPGSRTLVVVPSMLLHPPQIQGLLEGLEVSFLANRDGNLHFGLLTDFCDATEETLPGDATSLDLARAGIESLNAQYTEGQDNVFFLFHRPRAWNPHDRIWMGFERKRGKLADLNHLLSGGMEAPFSLLVGDTAALAGVKYVITLDSDTQLPRDAAHQCVGAMAHPLNRPVYDAEKRRVSAGYGILQPRVSPSPLGSRTSQYEGLSGGVPGIDPYTRTVSDVYQDVFHEGSFIGKGIYDIEAFERALQGRFPENRILSHDLLEGCYARAGLLSDVELYERSPTRFSVDVKRRHRWIRGDWQLAAWLLPYVPGPRGWVRNRGLSSLSRWKLFDNLRRSLLPGALTLTLLLGWTWFSTPWLCTVIVLGVLFLPPVLATLLDLSRRPDDLGTVQHLATVASTAGRRFLQACFALVSLPYEAFYSLDAIGRTLGRSLITHRRLLEWDLPQDPARLKRAGLPAAFRSMWFAPLLAVFATAWMSASRPEALAFAGPVLLLWLASPAIAWWISLPRARREERLSAAELRFLGRIARKTWAFFETFVGEEDHWLPPDNYQERRDPTVAHRTSPTNMGLALLANLSALDFGYIPGGVLVDRTARALDTMAGLERHRGHFYNWYDTESLVPLNPRYVSSVDSGNLAGHLLTLRRGLLALPDRPILEPRWRDGLRDTLEILEDCASKPVSGAVDGFREELEALDDTPATSMAQARLQVDRLARSAEAVALTLGPETGSESSWWGRTLERQCQALRDEIGFLVPGTEPSPDGGGDRSHIDGIPTLRLLVERGAGPSCERARARIANIERLALLADDLADMEYGFLYDEAARLLSIGYNVDERRLDASFYDLLASEARLCVFVGIAQGQLPQESWFAMGRLLTSAGGTPVLLSWSGSMFEYLMPQLVMPTYEHTLLDQTARAAIGRQIQYGRQRGVPWGMSESGYDTRDIHLNYQYRAFGVPSLALKRGLEEDLVVAPYASMLALMLAPEAACRNLKRLSALGAEGRFGYHEALDYTPTRQRPGELHSLVLSYMAHHQGMSLLSLAALLLDRRMQKLFISEPRFHATVPLLQERIPRGSPSRTYNLEPAGLHPREGEPGIPMRVLVTPDTPSPEVQLLSNGRYHVMVTNAGGGYSRWNGLAVTRWREDSTRDPWGTFCYLRDMDTGLVWTTAHQPVCRRATRYEAIFSEGRAEFRRRDGLFDTHTEIVVSPEDDIEIRRVHVTNRSPVRRTVEITSYTEVVLAPPADDELHPAFSNLFVQTEIITARHAILCTRRPRSRDEAVPWMLHSMAVHGADAGALSYETDRARFIGRTRTVADPRAMDDGVALSGSQGSVLDPVVAIRGRIALEAGQSFTIDHVYGIAETRAAALSLVDKYQDRRLADRVFELAWTHAQVVLRQIEASTVDAQLYGRLAGPVLYSHRWLRAHGSLLVKNRRGQSGLWGYAISGDLPIVLLRIGDATNIELARQLIQAHAYWRLKGLAVDLVIWNEDHAGYRQELQKQILGLVAEGVDAQVIDRPGGIFIRSMEQISEEDRTLFQTVARVILSDGSGTLKEQLARGSPPEIRVVGLSPTARDDPEPPVASEPAPRDLVLANHLGGFSPDGREYVITTTPDLITPAPWVNVLANPGFGSVISESGQSYSWSENAHEFRLTPWHCDPVSDPGGEVFYLRDEETGRFWSPTPLPRRGATPYVTRHGFGYSVFEHTEAGIRSELWVYVATDAAVKFSRLRVWNLSGRPRRLSATGYVEWVLGDLRSRTAMHVSTEIDPVCGALLARNPYNTEFPGRVAFFDVDEVDRSTTCNRTEFIGRNGSLERPAALARASLSGRMGAGLDPCAAIQVPFDLADGQSRDITFRLGMGGASDGEDHQRLVLRLRGADVAKRKLEAVRQQWMHTLGAVQVELPDPSLTMLTNGWLLYQTIACRFWARSGFYQSGGAFGFRDQLQDAMALVHAEPRLVREHLLACAARQFPEGDVQHWWHPPSGRGVRTRCSDDYLWLALVACRYVQSTGDTGVLEERVHYLEGRAPGPDEDSCYDLPVRSETAESLYEHCVRAIRRGLSAGAHGLPLMGSGDWNDGMNRVGVEGKGESVWLGFFQCEVLRQFGALARQHGDAAFADQCAVEGARLRDAIEQDGWDGAWYRRAFFDDGTPLGSSINEECRIDAISQSWAVLSGVADPKRARLAMGALDEKLVRREHALIQLLDPPFDHTDVDPGYIKGYVPGVRENGGQYTHSAVWAAMAFAALGDRERAFELTAMIDPARHAATPEAVETYKVEPYVVAADVYAVKPHTGRGGWTWYTGSAGWMYRLILESLLGLRLDVDRLYIEPCIPAHWSGFRIHYRYRKTVYHIAVTRVDTDGAGRLPEAKTTIDGVESDAASIPLVDDHREHWVEVGVRGK